MKHIEVNVRNRVGYITLDRPAKRNALNDQMVSELSEEFDQMASRDEVKAVVLGAKGKAFCAGADLEYLQQIKDNDLQRNLEDSRRLKELLLKIFRLNKVVIANVHGPAIAGGSGLVSVCDFAFSSQDATFGYPEVRIGFVPAIVMPFLLNKVSGHHTRELMLSGRLITANEARDIGLIYKVLQDEKLDEVVTQFAEDLCKRNSGQSMASTKLLLSKTPNTPLESALDLACELNAQSRTNPDFSRGISNFLAKKDIVW